MAVIKSAWELALEKTKDIQVDTEKIERDEKVQNGRKLAASFLQDEGQTPDSIQAALDKLGPEDRNLYREGILNVILDNISLPQGKGYRTGYERLTKLAGLLGNPALSGAMAQIGQFMDQYLDQQDQITDQAKAQWEPQLRQKEAQIRQQYGQEVHLQPEQDPEFLKALSGTLKQLDAQYGQALTRFKGQLTAMLKQGR